MKAVITVIGNDKPGIIAKVSGLLFSYNINILDITQTIMQNMFTMIMLADFSGAEVDIKTIDVKLAEAADEMGLSIHVQREELFKSMHRI